jgi:hypothetical protein
MPPIQRLPPTTPVLLIWNRAALPASAATRDKAMVRLSGRRVSGERVASRISWHSRGELSLAITKTPPIEPAHVFEDRRMPGQWRVEWFDDDGRCELEIFTGPDARRQALRFATRRYGRFVEAKLAPYSRA